jgi:3-oxoacyl-[acyl-carrier protein] reductase
MSMRFEGRTVLITGGGAGIGRAMAVVFCAEGARVLIADVDAEAAEGAVEELGRGRARALVVDMGDVDSVAALVGEALADGDGVDVLCNNAGIFDDYKQAHEMGVELWQRSFDVNVRGPFLLAGGLAPRMVERGRGAIVTTASIAGVIAGAGGVAYTASKHAVIGLARQLAFDYGPHVRSNAICPGTIATKMTREALALGGGNPHIEAAIAALPAGRWGEPEEVARVTAFLASDDASFVQGATIMIDGGWSIV